MSEDTDRDSTSEGQVDSVVGGTNCSVDSTDPINPIVNADASPILTLTMGTNMTNSGTTTDPILDASGGGGAIQGGRVSRTSGVTGRGNSNTSMSWETEVYDDNSFIDIAGDSTRLTIPSGVTRVNVSALILSSSVDIGVRCALIIAKHNSSDVFQINAAFTEVTSVDATPSISVCALGIDVVAGDIIHIKHLFDDTSWTFAGGNACIQDVSP